MKEKRYIKMKDLFLNFHIKIFTKCRITLHMAMAMI